MQESIVSDSLRIATETTGKVESGSGMFNELFEHAHDSHEIELPFIGHIHLPQFQPVHVVGMTIDFSITKHVVFLWVAAVCLLVIAVSAARKNTASKVPHGIGNLIEMVVVFIRDEIVLPNMGTGGLRYLPYLVTTMFFILIMNLMGMIPYGSTSTGNVNVTAGLAIIAFIMIQLSAIRA